MVRDRVKRALAWQKYYAQHKEKLLARAREIRKTEEYRAKCRTQRARYRSENRSLVLAKQREYMRVNGVRFRYKYPERVLARHLVKNAIRQGVIVRQPCWCGEIGQAHHDDYTKPYQIIWLCKKHHAELHRKQGVLYGRPRG